jgi:hypothetical protein
MITPVSYKRPRFAPEIIAHAGWLSFRFPLSLRLVEDMLLERGIDRVWRDHPAFGSEIRAGRCSPRPSQTSPTR